jgi:hypothetical protein
VYLGRHYQCAEADGTCECTAGLGLFPLRVCSPVALAGTRGDWTVLKLHWVNLGVYRDWLVYPDGRVERVNETAANQSETTLAQLSPEDLDQVTRSVDGPDLRTALAANAPCGPFAEDLRASLSLTLDTTTLEREVSNCYIDRLAPYRDLIDLIMQY